MVEHWVNIKNYPNYWVSNTGKVKTKFRVLKPHFWGQYETVLLYNKEGTKRFPVHRLVYDHFSMKHTPKNWAIDHIDENKTNNHINNLQGLTMAANVIKSYGYNSCRWREDRQRWEAQYTNGPKGIRIFLGRFKNKKDAVSAYLNAVKEHDFVTYSQIWNKAS